MIIGEDLRKSKLIFKESNFGSDSTSSVSDCHMSQLIEYKQYKHIVTEYIW